MDFKTAHQDHQVLSTVIELPNSLTLPHIPCRTPPASLLPPSPLPHIQQPSTPCAFITRSWFPITKKWFTLRVRPSLLSLTHSHSNLAPYVTYLTLSLSTLPAPHSTTLYPVLRSPGHGSPSRRSGSPSVLDPVTEVSNELTWASEKSSAPQVQLIAHPHHMLSLAPVSYPLSIPVSPMTHHHIISDICITWASEKSSAPQVWLTHIIFFTHATHSYHQ